MLRPCVWGAGVASDVFKEELRFVTLQLATKLSPIIKFSDEMETAIRVLCQNEAQFARHDEIIAAGDPYKNAFLVKSGWAVRYKLLESGMRQVVNFVLPGDFMCYNAALFARSDFYLAAQTELSVFVIPVRPFREMLAFQPDLALVLSWANSHEESLLAERIVSLGRRSAQQRMAHLFCELGRRLQLLGLADTDEFPLPITQVDLADTLGLSAVHVNRTLRKLREQGLIRAAQNRIRIDDVAGLEQVAGFDSGYLHFLEAPGALYR